MIAREFDVIVVGAGLVGATAALALGRAGLRTAMIGGDEGGASTPAADWDARIFAISPGSVRFLELLGVWSRVPAERIASCVRMEIFGDEPGARLVFRAYDSGIPALAYMLESRALSRALSDAIGELAHVTRFTGVRVNDLTRAGATTDVTLDTGDRVLAPLVIGADGQDSIVRTLAGIAIESAGYDELGVVANFTTASAHKGCAYQWFRGDSVLALLPLPGPRVSMVWSTRVEHAHRLLAMTPEALAAELEAVAGSTLGHFQVITPARAYPLSRLRATHLVADGIALIGDAAHVIHPLAGQGVNLGLADAEVLVRHLSAREPIRALGDVRLLRRYERERAEPLAAMRAVTHGLHWLYGLEGKLPKRLRNAGLNLTHRLPVVRSVLARRAIGH